MKCNPFTPILVSTVVVSALLLMMSGCATPPPASASKPGSGLAEYLDLVQRSHRAVDSILTALGKLNSQATAPSAASVAAFSKELDHLDSESVQIRARSKAMQARGDAYFANWQENMASLPDPEIRASAEQHRPELQHSFAAMKVVLEQTKESFQSLLTALHKLRTSVEVNPSTLSTAANQDLVRSAQQNGQRVESDLDTIAAELRHMMAMLNLPGPSARK